MNRTIEDATVKVYHYDDLESLKAHVVAFVAAYNFAKHLKALRWKTLYHDLRGMDERPVNLQDRSAPSHAGTTQTKSSRPATPRSRVHQSLTTITRCVASSSGAEGEGLQIVPVRRRSEKV